MLCTDGLANIGLGSLENLETDEQKDEVAKWYEDVGNYALSKGVTVNVISITDGECRLENLGKVTDVSQGNVERINPLELKDNFRGILTKVTLATNVQATIYLHPCLRFKKDNEEIQQQELKKAQQTELKALFTDKNKNTDDSDKTATSNNTLKNNDNNNNNNDNKNDKNDKNDQNNIAICRETQDVGNVFEDTKIFFEYALLKDKIHKDYSQLTEIPFQVQIHYTRLDSAKMLRVISQTKPITKDRQQVIDNLDMNIMAQHNMKKTARLCEEGDYEAARAVTYANAMWMSNNNNNNNNNYNSNNNANTSFVSRNMGLDFMMQQQQMTEINNGSTFAVNDSKKKRKQEKSKDTIHLAQKCINTKNNESKTECLSVCLLKLNFKFAIGACTIYYYRSLLQK